MYALKSLQGSVGSTVTQKSPGWCIMDRKKRWDSWHHKSIQLKSAAFLALMLNLQCRFWDIKWKKQTLNYDYLSLHHSMYSSICSCLFFKLLLLFFFFTIITCYPNVKTTKSNASIKHELFVFLSCVTFLLPLSHLAPSHPPSAHVMRGRLTH